MVERHLVGLMPGMAGFVVGRRFEDAVSVRVRQPGRPSRSAPWQAAQLSPYTPFTEGHPFPGLRGRRHTINFPAELQEPIFDLAPRQDNETP